MACKWRDIDVIELGILLPFITMLINNEMNAWNIKFFFPTKIHSSVAFDDQQDFIFPSTKRKTFLELFVWEAKIKTIYSVVGN